MFLPEEYSYRFDGIKHRHLFLYNSNCFFNASLNLSLFLVVSSKLLTTILYCQIAGYLFIMSVSSRKLFAFNILIACYSLGWVLICLVIFQIDICLQFLTDTRLYSLNYVWGQDLFLSQLHYSSILQICYLQISGIKLDFYFGKKCMLAFCLNQIK